MAMDNEQIVEVVFTNQFNIISKVHNRLSHRIVYEKDSGDYVYMKLKITGIMDFMNWIRTFGSSVVIISPEYLVKKHKQTANKVLKRYEIING